MASTMRAWFAIAVGALATGCAKHAPEPAPATNACTNNTRADAYVAGLTKRGTGGHFDFKLVAATPEPPARGDNTWVVEVDAAGGGAVAAAALTATPFMPDHGHGTPMKVAVTALGTPGQYQLAPVNLWMPGYWETSVTATVNGVADTAVLKFCIPN
jgi:hypothetical protein